jgi:gamma-glutamylcyclotransferase (GGCT)/AIG2-like uncharacterized protein YtfP
MYVTVYGTLQKGQSNNRLLENATLVTECIVRGYKLYNSGFPVSAPSELDSIRGEVWDIGSIDSETWSDTLRNLDSLEGYYESERLRDRSMYFRETIQAFGDDGNTYEAEMYVGNPKFWKDFSSMRECPVVDNVYEWSRR